MSFLTTTLLCIMCFILSFRVTNQLRSLTDIMCMGKRYRRHNKIMAAGALEVIKTDELLEHGNEFIVEDMNYKALQKRSKETKVNAKTGRIHTKKRFGKSLSRCAPAMFITILTNKVTRYGGKVIKASTFETKASQFDHTDESYTKKKLSERMAHLSSGEVVQRDLYSAFLLEHIDTESLEYNTEALKSAFPAFLKMHENTKKHLQKEENNLPASVGF